MRFFFIGLSFILALATCKKNDVEDCFVPRGEEKTETRNVDDFTEIAVRDFFEVILTQDSVNSIAVETGENIIPFIKTRVKDGVLTLTNEIECNWARDYGHPKIHISVINLEFVFMKEPCNLISTNVITSDELHIWARANLGEANVQVECNRFKFTSSHRTAGIYEFSGICNEFEIDTWGATKVYASGLMANSVEAISNSVGDIFVYSANSISATINSSGDIVCTGNPEIIEVDGEGSGRFMEE